jgi:glucose 1-dehydrogenase
MTRPLEGQVAIVTGAATGIGDGIARELARRGAAVMVNHLHQEKEAKAMIDAVGGEGGKAAEHSADVAKPDEVTRLVAATVERFGRLDIMVANAGIQVDAPTLEMTPEQWDKAMNVDLRGSFLCAQAAARQFLEQGLPPHSKATGKILCMLSVHDSIPWMCHANYAAAKAGAEMMMKTLAQEWGQHKIRVMGISPGAIRTPINQGVWSDEARYRSLLKLIPYGRIGEVEDVARVAGWLVSDEADYVTGSTIYVDGGMLLYPGFMGNG